MDDVIFECSLIPNISKYAKDIGKLTSYLQNIIIYLKDKVNY